MRRGVLCGTHDKGTTQGMRTHTIYTRSILEAEKILGGPAELRKLLHASIEQIAQWKSGEQRPPMMVFLKLVDVLDRRSQFATATRMSARKK